MKRLATISKQCVACGVCVKICPVNAVSLYKGKFAVIDREKCTGCGKCAAACPAAVITIVPTDTI